VLGTGDYGKLTCRAYGRGSSSSHEQGGDPPRGRLAVSSRVSTAGMARGSPVPDNQQTAHDLHLSFSVRSDL